MGGAEKWLFTQCACRSPSFLHFCSKWGPESGDPDVEEPKGFRAKKKEGPGKKATLRAGRVGGDGSNKSFYKEVPKLLTEEGI